MLSGRGEKKTKTGPACEKWGGSHLRARGEPVNSLLRTGMLRWQEASGKLCTPGHLLLLQWFSQLFRLRSQPPSRAQAAQPWGVPGWVKRGRPGSRDTEDQSPRVSCPELLHGLKALGFSSLGGGGVHILFLQPGPSAVAGKVSLEAQRAPRPCCCMSRGTWAPRGANVMQEGVMG